MYTYYIHVYHSDEVFRTYIYSMAVRSLKLLGGGQSEVEKGTLLIMMIWHKKKGTYSQKGYFFPRLPPAPPPPG